MAVVVQKYGGSSVASPDALRSVAHHVVARRRSGDSVVVVVSAMGDTTDDLIAMARQIAAVPPQRELDMLVTAGERISMALLSMAIIQEGEAAISFTGSQSGIITDNSHQGARIVDVRPHRLVEALHQDRIVIVAGYQGVSLECEVTTLGRGGSDTSAVALAAALQADACEIYSDVDGVYSADPRVCPAAKLIPHLSYETMQAMAAAGAQVLNHEAVEFARRAGIAIYARRTGDGSGRQTVVGGGDNRATGAVAVVAAPHVTWLGAASSYKPKPEAFAEGSLLNEVAEAGGRTIATVESPQFAALIDRIELPGCATEPVDAVARKHGLSTREVSAVTVIGNRLRDHVQVLRALEVENGRTAGLEPPWLGDDRALSIAVDPQHRDAVVCRLHEALIL